MGSENLRDLILFLFEKVDKSDSLEGATKYHTLKLLFKLDQELPHNHSLKFSIPYYWYFHGPLSDPVTEKLSSLLGNGLEIFEKNRNTLYRIQDSAEYNPNNIDEETRNIINQLLEPKNFFQIDKKVYKEYAPYEFMYPYKFIFLENIKKYGKVSTDESENSDLMDDAVDLCYDCESKLPGEKYFLEYEDLFSKFARTLDKINRNDIGKDYFIEIFTSTNKIWETFAYGLRTQHHHNYYENSVSQWDAQFKSEIDNLNYVIEDFSSIARSSSRKPKIKFSETSKKILSSSIQAYTN
jgi:hypothetical protein